MAGSARERVGFIHLQPATYFLDDNIDEVIKWLA